MVILILDENKRTACKLFQKKKKKDPDAGKDWRQEKKGTTEDEMVGWHHRLDGHEFEQFWEMAMDREAWHAAVHWVAKSQTWLSNQTTINDSEERTALERPPGRTSSGPWAGQAVGAQCAWGSGQLGLAVKAAALSPPAAVGVGGERCRCWGHSCGSDANSWWRWQAWRS